MLSTHEQRIWDDVERNYAIEIEEPVLPAARLANRRRLVDRGVDDLPTAVVAGIWISIFLILFGAMSAALAVGAATTAGALLWRYWPLLRDETAAQGPVPVRPSSTGRGPTAADR
ncbi:DUF3040 domain-containing protein [Modestobacter marinus]|uniref:DUF3040 domain-containing protein n=1 Tax=Modestobacter marinus TaxID=477641 RepID=UPI001C94A22C|nr:DUF3040 domain-containing protein [Modestobacter marinus]